MAGGRTWILDTRLGWATDTVSSLLMDHFNDKVLIKEMARGIHMKADEDDGLEFNW